MESGQEPFCVPIHLFSVANESSLREPPSLEGSLKLLEQFQVDGFVSAGEPVLIRFEDGLPNEKKT